MPVVRRDRHDGIVVEMCVILELFPYLLLFPFTEHATEMFIYNARNIVGHVRYPED